MVISSLLVCFLIFPYFGGVPFDTVKNRPFLDILWRENIKYSVAQIHLNIYIVGFAWRRGLRRSIVFINILYRNFVIVMLGVSVSS